MYNIEVYHRNGHINKLARTIKTRFKRKAKKIKKQNTSLFYDCFIKREKG